MSGARAATDGPAMPSRAEAGGPPAGCACAWWLGPALAVAVTALALAEAWQKFYSYQDDAFIFFRYAENLLDGAGLAFNPGERVEGFTSPLWLALLVATGALGLMPVHAAGILGTAATVATLLLSVRDARRCGPPGPWMAIAPLVLASSFPLLAWSVGGMDTALFVALVWGALSEVRIAAREGRTPGWRIGFLVAAAAATRPEGAMLAAALAVDTALPEAGSDRAARRSRLVRLVLPAAGVVVLLTACRWLTYGEFLPNTALAKRGGTLRHGVLGLEYLKAFAFGAPLVWPALLLLRRRWASRVPARRATAFLLALWCLYVLYTGGDYFPYHRFVIPLLPLISALGAAGLHAAWEVAWSRAGRVAPGTAATAAVAIAIIGAFAVQRDPMLLRKDHGFDWTLACGKLGRILGRVLPPGALVGVPHIGAIGYYSRRPVLDFLGLVDRDLAHRPRRLDRPKDASDIGHEHFDIEWSMRRRPHVVALSRTYGSRPFTDASELAPAFSAEHRLLEHLRGRPDYRLVSVPIDRRGYWALYLRTDVGLPAAVVAPAAVVPAARVN